MFRNMRRFKQQLSCADAAAVLDNGTHGVLALLGDDGYPYAVPLGYAYCNGRLYFHCAKTGHKLDAIRACGKASFCVVAQDDVVPENFTTLYRSVIAFGTVRIIESEAERLAAINAIADKYSPGNETERLHRIERDSNVLCLLELTVEHLSGKGSMTLVKARPAQ